MRHAAGDFPENPSEPATSGLFPGSHGGGPAYILSTSDNNYNQTIENGRGQYRLRPKTHNSLISTTNSFVLSFILRGLHHLLKRRLFFR